MTALRDPRGRRPRSRPAATATVVLAAGAMAANLRPFVDDGSTAQDAASALTTSPLDSVLSSPPGLIELSPGLFSSSEIGVPDAWAPTDLDPTLLTDPDFAGDVDPFRGAVTCPDGVVRDTEAPWIARRFSTVDFPLASGLFSIEMILELESAAEFEADVTQLPDCTPSEQTTIIAASGTLPAPSDRTPYRLIDATSDATTQVPYESAATALWSHEGDFSVTVIFSGTSPHDDWSADIENLSARLLRALTRSEDTTSTTA